MWLKDPINNNPSVSLTLLVLSAAATLVVCGLHTIDLIKHTSSFVEILYSMVALYFGRRMTFNGKLFSSEENKKESSKNE